MTSVLDSLPIFPSNPPIQYPRRPIGAPIIRMGVVTSTMDVARHLQALGAAEGITVVAASQIRGRGRADRSWHSSDSTGLYCSILLRPRIPAIQFQAFSIAVGLALCEALDPGGELELRLKWPNDILCCDKKLAGILVTSGLSGNNLDWAILGIGLNLLNDPDRPDSAISLSEIHTVSSAMLSNPIRSITEHISTRYDAILRDDPAQTLAGWPERLAWLHQPVIIENEVGFLRGIDERGALLLETSDGIAAISAGELTRGPRQHPTPRQVGDS